MYNFCKTFGLVKRKTARLQWLASGRFNSNTAAFSFFCEPGDSRTQNTTILKPTNYKPTILFMLHLL